MCIRDRIPEADRKFWSVETPYLYDYEILLGEDVIYGYFALRTFTKEKDKDGVTLTYYTGKMANDTELLPLMREKNVEIQPYIQNDAMISIALNIMSIVVPMILLWVLFSGFMRRMGGGGGVMGVGKSKAKVYIEKETGVTFTESQNSVNALDVYCEPWSECKIRPSLIVGCDSSAFRSVRIARSLVMLRSVMLAITLRSCKSIIVQL